MGNILKALGLPDPFKRADFQPQVEVLGESFMVPVLVPIGEEVSLQIKISNWAVAPNDLQLAWSTPVTTAKARATIEGEGDSALLSVQGVAPSTGIVRVRLTTTFAGVTLPFDIPAIVVLVTPGEGPDDSVQSKDQGGSATVTDLEQDMGILMGPWLTAAGTGVTQFSANALSDEIDDLTSGSMESFLDGLVGNTMWAATCFFPGAGALRVFAVSMAGIAAAAVPSIPHASKSHIPEVQQAMNRYLFDVFGKLTPRFRATAQRIVDAHPSITRYQALNLFAKASLAAGTVHIDPSFQTKPRLDLQVIANKMEAMATQQLKGWVASQKETKDKAAYDKLIRETSHRQPGEL